MGVMGITVIQLIRGDFGSFRNGVNTAFSSQHRNSVRSPDFTDTLIEHTSHRRQPYRIAVGCFGRTAVDRPPRIIVLTDRVIGILEMPAAFTSILLFWRAGA